ncbi:MAG: HEAT repeat domain-containing protein, partial [Phycisphaerae bacterium]|nr:HEAT repeat domain-containing protein [Phycisphaerae bacterium]
MNACAKILTLAAAALAAVGCGEKGNRAFSRRLNPPSWRQRVAMAVDHDDADNRRMGINYMAPDTKCSDTGTLKLFAFILANDRDPFVRAAAVTALGTVGNTDFAPDAIAALDDGSEVVRWDAAMALGKLVVDEALEPLIARAASDPSTNVRIAAAQSLGSYRKGRSVRTLLQLMDVGDLSVRRAAHQSMVKIYRVDLGDDPECWADAAAGDIPPALTQAQLDAQKSWWRRFREKRQQPREQGDPEQQAEE